MKFSNSNGQGKKFNTDIVNTVVGEEAQFNGKLHTQCSIRIEGGLEGEINCQGDVYIGENSTVKANIMGKNIIVAGEVVGNIETLKGLHITRTGRVYGDISGDHLTIEEGAIYKGKVNMDVISSKNDYEGAVELTKK